MHLPSTSVHTVAACSWLFAASGPQATAAAHHSNTVTNSVPGLQELCQQPAERQALVELVRALEREGDRPVK